MVLRELRCPACNGAINIDVSGKDSVLCPYCDSRIMIDDEIKREEETIHVHFNNNINIHKRISSDVEGIWVILKDYIKRNSEIAFPILMMFLLLIFLGLKDIILDTKAVALGMIRVGQSSEDMKGENYRVVEQQLRSARFGNITSIDLDDAGWLINKEDTIKSVTIGGDANFAESDYFDPSSVVVISYH